MFFVFVQNQNGKYYANGVYFLQQDDAPEKNIRESGKNIKRPPGETPGGLGAWADGDVGPSAYFFL
jgi:hypothetical protein